MTFSVYYIRLCFFLNKIQAAQRTKKELNLDNVLECARLSALNQYPLKDTNLYPGARRKAKTPCTALVDLYKAFDKAHPCQYKAGERPLPRRAPNNQQILAYSGSRPRNNGCRKSSDNSQSLGHVISVSSPDPFAVKFEGSPASDAVRPIMHTISNSFL